jgi:hypothetical protein
MITKFNQYLFESSNEQFSTTFNNNLSVSYENLISLIDMVPEKEAVGTPEYEARRKELNKKRFDEKISFYRQLAGSPSLKSALELAYRQANKYYNGIKTKLDPSREAKAQAKAERMGKETSLPGMEYKPAPMPKEVLNREPIAKYFLESIGVLRDIAEELENPGYEELKTTLLASFKEYFGELGAQPLQEKIYLIEEKKKTTSYLQVFNDLKNVVELYKSRLMNMISSMNSVLAGVDESSPLKKYSPFVDKIWAQYDWLNDPKNFFLGNLSAEEQEKKVMTIKAKVEEVADFLADATFTGGQYSNFIKDASKPVSLGLGQFDNMLNQSSRLISQGLEKMARLQSILTNMWKEIRMFRGFSAADIGKALSDLDASNQVSGQKVSSLAKALEKKKGVKKASKLNKQAFKKIDDSAINDEDTDAFVRALSPITNYRNDIEKLSSGEREFTMSTRILGNEKGLPNLKEFEQRFSK